MAFINKIGAELVTSALQGLGSKSYNFIAEYRNRPDKLTKLTDFESATKQTAMSSLSSDEGIIEEIMALALQQTNMPLHRTLDTIRTKLVSIRHTMESASLMLYPNSAANPNDIINNVSLLNVALVYFSFVIENKCMYLRDELEFNPSMDTNEILREMRSSTTALEKIWNLRPKTVINEETAKAIKESCNAVSKNVVDLIEKISNSSFTEVEQSFKEVSLKKPKLFRKGQYIDNLGEIMVATVKSSGQNEMNNIDIRDRLTKRYSGVTITLEDMEKAARNLLDKKLIHGIREEEKNYVIELRKTGESPVCGNCKKSGGYMVDYYTCPKGFVCSDCISFFGKCKVCGAKIKDEDHKLIV